LPPSSDAVEFSADRFARYIAEKGCDFTGAFPPIEILSANKGDPFFGPCHDSLLEMNAPLEFASDRSRFLSCVFWGFKPRLHQHASPRKRGKFLRGLSGAAVFASAKGTACLRDGCICGLQVT
jgi:hypothetical protein